MDFSESLPLPEWNIEKAFVSHQGQVRRTSYKGPCSLAGLASHCRKLFDCQAQSDLVLSVSNPDNAEVVTLLEDPNNFRELSLVYLHKADQPPRGPINVEERLTVINAQLAAVLQAVVVPNDHSPHSYAALAPIGEGSAEADAPEAKPVRQLSRAATRPTGKRKAASLLDRVKELRDDWVLLKRDAVESLERMRVSLATNGHLLALACAEHASNSTDIMRTRRKLTGQKKQYEALRCQLSKAVEAMEMFINYATREFVVNRATPPDGLFLHGAEMVEEINNMSDEVKRKLNLLDDGLRAAWKAEVSTAVQEEEFLKEETIKYREAMENMEDAVQVFLHLSRVVSVQAHMERPKRQYGKEDLSLREKNFTALMLEIEHIGARDSEQRLERMEQINRWREMVREIKKKSVQPSDNSQNTLN